MIRKGLNKEQINKKRKKLNICCGVMIKKGWDNADIQKNDKVIYCDINKYPYPFKDNTYDYILLRGAFMYAENPERVLEELRRISKHNAIIRLEEVPYYNNKGAVTCLGARSFFSETTFIDFVSHYQPNPKDSCYFPTQKHFEILKINISPSKIGKWIYPKWLRMKLSGVIGGLINSIDVEFKVIKLSNKFLVRQPILSH